MKVKGLDSLAGSIVRSRGYCEVKPYYPRLKCDQVFQWGHIISRGYTPIRWNLNNGFCICRVHHRFFTGRQIEWDEVVLLMIGPKHYEELKKLALGPNIPPKDYGEVAYELNQRKKNGFIFNELIIH
jgi:hypothetical protein